jgi:hypothetical protein
MYEILDTGIILDITLDITVGIIISYIEVLSIEVLGIEVGITYRGIKY